MRLRPETGVVSELSWRCVWGKIVSSSTAKSGWDYDGLCPGVSSRRATCGFTFSLLRNVFSPKIRCKRVITSVPFARNPLPSFTRGRTQRREISRTWRVINQIEDDTLHALIYIPWRRSNRAIEKCDSDLCDNDAELFKLIGMVTSQLSAWVELKWKKTKGLVAGVA